MKIIPNFHVTLYGRHHLKQTMFKTVTAFCVALLLPFIVRAQQLPKEGSLLNYRLIGFRFPAKPLCKYTLEIARGTHFTEDSFDKKIIITQPSAQNKLIAEVPQFGRDYTWRTVYTDAKKTITKSALHHFSTRDFKGVDSTLNRVRVIDTAVKYKDAYVFMEANRALYDMKGKPVWFLPVIDNITSEWVPVLDLQLTDQGTATFLFDAIAGYEVDYNGKIVFKTPKKGKVNGDSIEYVHHEFKRLKNGHYMVIGSEIAQWDKSFVAANDSTSLYFLLDNRRANPINSAFQRVPFGTIIEYDRKGNVVWSWRSSKYFKGSDIFNHLVRGDVIDVSAHENSFYFDEKNKYIITSFRDISRIIKITYPEGKVMKVWGEPLKQGKQEAGNGVYCRQHGVKMTAKGEIILYNNNACNFTGFPSVVMFDPNTSEDEVINKTWEYKCPIEGQTGTTQTQYQFTYGGNVLELPDGDIFVSMSTLYSRSFIVSRDKKLLWSAIPERWNKETKLWENVFQFKASPVINHKDLEKFIWNQEE